VRHLGFKLDKAGEQIGLAQDLDTGFVFVDSLSYGVQSADVSFGRYPDGSMTWASFGRSTPGSSNQNPNDVDDQAVPEKFALTQNYPNPFNPETVIRYQVPVTSNVKLSVYDMLGREVMVLVDETKMPGRYEVRFSTGSRSGSAAGAEGLGAGSRGFASGVYIYRLTARAYVETRKMLLLK